MTWYWWLVIVAAASAAAFCAGMITQSTIEFNTEIADVTGYRNLKDLERAKGLR